MQVFFRLLVVWLILQLILILTSCASLVNTEYENVEVKIVDEYHRAMWMQPIRTGNVTTFITHPARYEIIVEYKSVEYTIDDNDTYDRYKDKVGQTATGILEIRTYKNGAVKQEVVELK